MDLNEYKHLANLTKADRDKTLKRIIANPDLIDAIHACFGFSTETGEFVDGIKRHIFYGTPLDVTNADEEIGDMFWYAGIFAVTFDIDLQKTLEKNIAKLKARFPNKFTTENAVNRDLETERKILEGK